MLTERQKSLVQQSWAEIVPIADMAAELLDNRLFQLDPSLEAMFAVGRRHVGYGVRDEHYETVGPTGPVR